MPRSCSEPPRDSRATPGTTLLPKDRVTRRGVGGTLTRGFLFGAFQGAVIQRILPVLPMDSNAARAAGLLLGAATAGIASGVVLHRVDRVALDTARRAAAAAWKRGDRPTAPREEVHAEEADAHGRAAGVSADLIAFASLEIIRESLGMDPVCPF